MPERPFTPNRPIITAVGAGAGLMLGLALAGAVEFRNRTVRTVSDVILVCGIPVLATLPALASESVGRGKRTRLLVWLGAGTTTGIALLLGFLALRGETLSLGFLASVLRRDARDGQPAPWVASGHVPCLDGLRAVSIAWCFSNTPVPKPGCSGPRRMLWLRDIGDLGVSMFFGISGFLITLLLLREWNRTNTISMKAFYARRALRILPVYFSYLFVVFVLIRLGVLHLKAGDWISALTYTVNFRAEPTWEVGHVWSLSIEEQFYLGWPLLLLFWRHGGPG